jgi:hypothetical protein
MSCVVLAQLERRMLQRPDHHTSGTTLTDRRRFAQRYLSTSEAADYLGMSVTFLRHARAKDAKTEGPPWIPVSRRKVLYDRHELDAWLARQQLGTTAAAEEQDAA